MKINSPILVIPCKDEAKRLKPAEFLAALAANPRLALLFVDDGSTDNTSELLSRLERESPSIHSIRMPRNVGKAEAVRQGVLWSLEHTEADAIGFWDADLATPLNELDAFVRVLGEHEELEVAFGVRNSGCGANINRSIFRKIASLIMNRLIRMVSKSSIRDTQCGAKIFCREIARMVFADPFISRWLFDVEIIRRIRHNRFENVIAEIPLTKWHEVADSKLKSLEIFRLVADLIKISKTYA